MIDRKYEKISYIEHMNLYIYMCIQLIIKIQTNPSVSALHTTSTCTYSRVLETFVNVTCAFKN